MDDEAAELILCPEPSDRRQLVKLWDTFKVALRSEHSKCQTLLAEREYLLQLIDLRNEQWARHVSILESRIGEIKAHEVKMQKYNAAKLESLVDMKERNASSYKEYAELTDADLKDAQTCIAALGAEIKALKSKLNNPEALRPAVADEGTQLKDLKLEIKKLKHAYKALKSEKEAKISEKESQIDALICEKDFVWNQFRLMEADFVALKSKSIEQENSSEEVTTLKKRLVEMEASILEKDSTISKLNKEMVASVSEKDATISQLKEGFQTSVSKKDGMISQLNGEVEDLKKKLKEKDQLISRLRADVAKFTACAGPLCNPVDSGTSRTLRSGSKRTRESVLRAQPSASQSVSGHQQHSNRSQGSAFNSTAETPRLFSAQFKVPKLKITPGTIKSTLPR